ncbi:hemolysin activation protein [Salmonella enterica subsp. enterica serovar London]|nr:hemolysin activation protein [Salmonella enterica subsp. enterica serovar London]EDR9846454.1 hemolysin activation protein [Salmonella enterica subsp. enterica serovar London]
MTLSFFITVIPDHDKPQPPGCLLGLIQKTSATPCFHITVALTN